MRKKKFLRWAALIIFLGLGIFLLDRPPVAGDWQPQFAVSSTAEFDGDQVLIKNVRNFRYTPTEADQHPDYYDKIYNLNEVKRVWYISEPFNENKLAAHTLLSF